jgi:alkylated DNA repair dioxygenase AlkB
MQQSVHTTILSTEAGSRLISDVFDDADLLDQCVAETGPLLAVRPPLVMADGRTYQHNRDVGFFSDASGGYAYSGQRGHAAPLTPSLPALIARINAMFDTNFNGVLVNRYNSGADNVGPHSDSEVHVSNIGVVSLAWGATRTFRVRDRATNRRVADVPSEHGRILWMAGPFQDEFKHEIPKQLRVTEPRVSFTFRRHTA